MPRTARSLRLAVVPLVAVVALTGCGGGDDGGDGGSDPGADPTSSSTAAEPTAAEQTVRDWLTATVEGDVAACGLETAAFRQTANAAARANLSQDGEPISCEQRIKRSAAALEEIGGEEYAETIDGAEVVTLEEDGGTATVEVTYNETGEPSLFTVVESRGQWLIDANSALDAATAAPTDDAG